MMMGNTVLPRGEDLLTCDDEVRATDVTTGAQRVVHELPEPGHCAFVAPAPAGLPAELAW